jgi:hypothetical protein
MFMHRQHRAETRCHAAPGAAAFRPASASFPIPGSTGYKFLGVFKHADVREFRIGRGIGGGCVRAN